MIAGNTPVLVHNCDTIDASKVRFTQDSAGSRFKDGRPVADLANGLADGSVDPMILPPIKIFRGEGGELFSLDNRRLFAGQYAGAKLPFQWATKAEIARRDMTYVDGGQSIRIRGEGWWSNG